MNQSPPHRPCENYMDQFRELSGREKEAILMCGILVKITDKMKDKHKRHLLIDTVKINYDKAN